MPTLQRGLRQRHLSKTEARPRPFSPFHFPFLSPALSLLPLPYLSAPSSSSLPFPSLTLFSSRPGDHSYHNNVTRVQTKWQINILLPACRRVLGMTTINASGMSMAEACALRSAPVISSTKWLDGFYLFTSFDALNQHQLFGWVIK